MTQKQSLQIFEDRKIRTVWDDEQEKWYISIVDAIEILTESKNPQTYWRVLKKRLTDEGNESVTSCNGFISLFLQPVFQDSPISTWIGAIGQSLNHIHH